MLRVIQRERPALGARKVGPLRVDTARGEWRLETLERMCGDEPSHCEAQIVQALDAVETPRPADDGEAQLQESLRPVLFGEATELTRQENQLAPADRQLIFKHFVGDLFVGYAFDAPRTVTHLGRRDLVKLGITLDVLHVRAVQNLAAATKPFEPQRIRPGLPFFDMKTTLELPDALLRRTKAAAAMRGVSMRDFSALAREQQLQQRASVPGWRRLAGKARKLDTTCVDRAVAREFSRVDEDTW